MISGNIFDVVKGVVYPGTLVIESGRIIDIKKDDKKYDSCIIPGFIDSHVHIESSMLAPSGFARIAVKHGTVAVVSDPHEIANVLGVEGVDYMIENGRSVPFKFYFGAPSCVPATTFETSGAAIDIDDIENLLKRDEIKFLSEVMNYPGVINEDPQIIAKLNLAKKYSKMIDGHAPGLTGGELEKYVNAGISTDHEVFTRQEAIEKLRLGMKILIREGSAAGNFDILIGLIDEYYNDCMFCCDDIHPGDLLKGHINRMVKKAINYGYDPMKVLKCACVNPVRHYGLGAGLLQKGDYADFLIVDNLNDLHIIKTFINGEVVAEEGRSLIPRTKTKTPNNFRTKKKKSSDFAVKLQGERVNIIEAIDGSLITNRVSGIPKVSGGYVLSDTEKDILKLTVVNRYKDAPPSIAFVKNFGLKKGAIASSIAHDSHNIIAVGVSDIEIADAVNLVIENMGGIAVVCDNERLVLPLPVAGIMTDEDGFEVAESFSNLEELVKGMGSQLNSPFSTLSFMALLVIPSIKLSDKGLFDGERFSFMPLFE